MKTLLLSLLLISFTAFAQSQELIDQYVQLAITSDSATLAGTQRGARVSCQFGMLQNPNLKAWGADTREASNRLQLLCIKDQCARLGAQVNQAAAELRDMPESDLQDFLEFSGMEAEERERTISNRNNYNETTAPVFNCATGSPTFRMVAFTMCFSTPVDCQRSRRR